MNIRQPSVAGQFYPADKKDCLEEIQQCIMARPVTVKLPEKIVAGIVPHAGWVFSGDLAAMVFNAVKKAQGSVDTFVLFGAAHRPVSAVGSVYPSGQWQCPLGSVEIDDELASMILENSDVALADTTAHRFEHSIEVQIPFIRYLFPQAKIVPVMAPAMNETIELGEDTAECIKKYPKQVVCIASTDLTHYGPRYGFYPAGAGPAGIDWAKNVNDMKMIDAAMKLDAAEVLATADENENACGAGAVAATVTAASFLGKQSGLLLAHTHSSEVMVRKFNQSGEESVGYAAIVF